MSKENLDIDGIIERFGNKSADAGNDFSKAKVGEHGNVAVVRERSTEDREMIKALLGEAVTDELRRGRLPDGYERSKFKSWGEFLSLGFNDPNAFREKYNPAVKQLRKALGDTINTNDFQSAGALVLPEFAPEVGGIIYDGDSLWDKIPQYTVAGDRMTFPWVDSTNQTDGRRHGGVRAYRTAEGDPAASSNMKYKTTTLDVEKMTVLVMVTDEMMTDSSYPIVQHINRYVPAELSWAIGNELVSGTGVGQCMGMVNSTHRVTATKEGGQSAGTVLSQNIFKMWARRMFRGVGPQGWMWLINPDLEETLPQMVLATGSSSGIVTYLPPGGLSAHPYGTLQGAPMIPCEFCSPVGTEGDIILWNPGGYIGVTKGAPKQAVDGSVEFYRDLKVIKITWRLNARPMYDEPFTLKNSSNKRSTIVTLQAR